MYQSSDRATGTCLPASHVSPLSLSLCLLSAVQTSEREKRQPQCALPSLRAAAASRLITVCCSASSPGKYPAEPRKRSLFHYITSRENKKLHQSTRSGPRDVLHAEYGEYQISLKSLSWSAPLCAHATRICVSINAP